MVFAIPAWHAPRRTWMLVTLLFGFGIAVQSSVPAEADGAPFRTYGEEQGLATADEFCLLQDGAGLILACSDHGIFAYDGRRFKNIGSDQGLRQGGFVFDLALTARGRVAVGYADEVLISDRPSDVRHPSTSLSFRRVLHPGLSFYAGSPHRLAPWRDGLVLIAGSVTVRIVVPDGEAPHVETMGYDLAEQRNLGGATAVFSVRGRLWETFDDGRICAADPGAVKCYTAADGLRGGPWMDIVAGSSRQIIARSANAVGTLDPGSDRWSVATLPDQGDHYESYRTRLGLFRAPDGMLFTQADHGLAMLGPNGWSVLTTDAGAPSGTLLGAFTDAAGQLWFQVFGRGLVRWLGYGHWETMQHLDGSAWQSVRPPQGALWISTDSAIDEIIRRGAAYLPGRQFKGPSFALAVDQTGKIWSSYGYKGARVVDPVSGSVVTIDVPPIDDIVPATDSPSTDDYVWIGTEAGLFRVDAHAIGGLRAVFRGSPKTTVPDMARDGAGGVFYLSGGRLRHQYRDGRDVAMAGAWPSDGFDPVSLAIDRKGVAWIGGAGGLFRFVLSDDHIASYQAVATFQTRTNTIMALMIDHRGWVWVGTTLGVSVFDGRHWVSADASGGLASNDVQQGGIREDPDGSVWIATTQGLSHLLDPEWLFADRPLSVVISRAQLGQRPVAGNRLPYSRQPLSIQLGTPSYGAEQSLVFRYRLSGVDAGWVESASGDVRYAFVPPGRHVLSVVGYDQLTHRTSPPVTLRVDVGFPWWRQWWSETLWLLAALGVAYGALRLRLAAALARQAELERHVAAATEEIRQAHEEIRVAHEEMRLAQTSLQYQAAHDSLTGLLNRCEIETRLAQKLAYGQAGDEFVAALFDLDHFKRVNDNHGHLGGDDVLRAIGRLIARTVGKGEFAGRYGGEEILLVLEDADGRGAERILDLHLAIRHDTFDAAGAAIHVTCSIGVAWAVHGDGWESLVGRADEALYAAKKGGRDRVVESRRHRSDFPGTAGRRPGPTFS